MDFRCLGTLGVTVGGLPVDLGEPQQRLVLAVLLAHAGVVVSTDRLVDAIWDSDPPSSGRKIVQGYVSGLRKVFDDSDVIESRSPGYLLNVKPAQIDAARFEELSAEGAAFLRSDPRRALTALEEALALWAGQPYEDLGDYDVLRPEITRLEQLRLTATENRFAAEIFSGSALPVVDELADITQRYPLRERLWTLRMLALYRSGRPAEALRAFDDARRYLASEVGLDPSMELQLVRDRILQQDPVLYTVTALEMVGRDRPRELRNPYKGLRAFDEADTDDFFGRDDLVRRLDEMMQRRDGVRLIVLTGASGTGKSSVVRAGLIPRLREDGWRVVSLYPGTDPIAVLAAALDESGGAERAVIFVDQLEELYTLVDDPEVRREFLDTVVNVVDPSTSGPWVVATMRADFLDDPMGHRRFAGLLDDALVIVTPLADHEIRAVVAGPASRVGVEVEPDLVATMVQEVARRPTALALLQFALTDLFDRAGGGRFTLEAYRAGGGLAGALIQRVEEMYSSFDAARQGAVRQVLLRMVTISDDAEPTRRRVAVQTLDGVDDSADVLVSLSDLRLVTFDRDADGVRTVEVAHEVLLREWPRLAAWIDDASDALRSHAQVASLASEWDTGGRDDADLPTGARLARFSDWDDTGITLSGIEREFLDASVTHERELRLGRRRRRRWTMAGFAAAALVATVFGVVAVERSRVADVRAREATAEAWAASARSVLDEDPELAVLLAVEALEIAPDSTAAMAALNDAMQAHRTIFAVQHDEPRSSGGSISPDGTLLATIYDARKLEVWRVGERSAPLWVAEVPQGRAIDAALFTDDGDQVVVFDGQPPSFDPEVTRDPVVFTMYDALTGGVDATVTVDDPCIAPAHVGAGTWNGFLDLELPMVTLRTPPGPESGLCLFDSPEADVVAIDILTGEIEDVAGFQGDLLAFYTPTVSDSMIAVGPGAVYDRATGQAILDLALGSATLSADGSRVLAGFNPMMLLDVATGATLREFPGDYDTAYFSSSEEYIVAAGFDGTTKIFETGTGWQRFALRGPGARDILAQMTADERLVATFSGDGNARVWDIGSQLIGTASTASFDADRVADFIPRASVVTTPDYILMPIGNNGTRRTAIFDITDGTLLATILGRVVAATPDGATAVLQSWSGPVELADYPGLSFREVGAFVVVDLPSGDVVTELSGPCTWHNNLDVEVYGPRCGDYPDPWAEWVMTGSISPDGTLFAMGGASGYVVVWNITTGEIVYFADSLSGGNQIVNGYAMAEFSPTGDELAIHQADPLGGLALRRVNTATWEVEAELTDLSSLLSELVYTPDGSLLIAGTWGSDVVVIDAMSWTVISALEGQQGVVLDVAVSPDGQLVVTAAVNGVAWVWDLESQTVVATFEFPATIPRNGLSNVEFVDAQTVLFSGELSAVLMALDPARSIATARSRLTRTFTEQECATYGIVPCPTSSGEPAG